MEEDIKIVKEIAGGFWERIGLNVLEPHKEEILKRKMEAIENILNRLEQLEKELEPIHKLGIPVEVLVSEFDRLENLEDDRVQLKVELEQLEKENKELKATLKCTQDSWFEDTKKIEEYKEYIDKNTIIAGDFNSNKQWDNLFNRKYNHSYLLNLLNNLDFISVYHNFYNQKQGEETAPTHYYHRNKEKSFHIDFMFIHKDRNIQSFSLGNFNDWISLSDHIPLFTEIM